jgi:transposase
VGESSAGVVWFAAPGFRVLSIDAGEVDVVVSIETDADRVGCHGCGVIARAKDRRWVTVRDAPSAERPVTLRWRKRVWQCVEELCAVKTWTEQLPEFVLPRHALTERAVGWATDRVAQIEATPASLARELGVTWSTAWTAMRRHGERRVDAVKGVEVAQVGFDETVMSPAKRHRRRRFITTAVDVTTGRIIDVFEGRNAADLQQWLGSQPAWWVSAIKVVSVDPHEGYRSAITGNELLADVTVVVDPFHIVRLAGQAVTKCRQRVQQATLERRGWKGDPLYGIRKLLLMGAEQTASRDVVGISV